MHALGVPTSRAAAIITSADPVVRDPFYNGKFQTEPAAIVLRFAPTWFRIGTIEILSRSGEWDLLQKVCKHVLPNGSPGAVLRYTTTSTAKMIAHWMSIGFTHGVCNTDNFSLLGITIDYGPFGFMEAYDEDYVPNTSDDEGRYAYGKQPGVGWFNIQKLFQALWPLLQDHGIQSVLLNSIHNLYWETYYEEYNTMFAHKIGFTSASPELIVMCRKLLIILERQKVDFTGAFRQLSETLLENLTSKQLSWALKSASNDKGYVTWVKQYDFAHRTSCSQSSIPFSMCEGLRITLMKRVNPVYVLKNFVAQLAIAASSQGDDALIRNVQRVLEHPFQRQLEGNYLGMDDPTPTWASDLKVTCSS
jgi:uncharacterized protein YdiU (UPF0061 family)